MDRVLELEEGTRFQVLAPVVRGRKGEYTELLKELQAKGYSRARVDGTIIRLDEVAGDAGSLPTLKKQEKHEIEVIIDRLAVKDTARRRLTDSVETALGLAGGVVILDFVDLPENDPHRERMYSEHLACLYDDLSFDELEPRSFSFNSPWGACPDCTGLGTKMEVDPELIVSDPEKSLNEGAIAPWAGGHVSDYFDRLIEALADTIGFRLDTPWERLPAKAKKALLYGHDTQVHVRYKNRYGRERSYYTDFEGAITYVERRHAEAESDSSREKFAGFMREVPCPSCKGSRLKPISLAVTIDDKSIAAYSAQPIGELAKTLLNLELSDRDMQIARLILKEVNARLGFLLDVGLDYLSLDRASATLAGGEAQRIRLATQIGSGLVGVLYVLDEPSIGLHQRDNQKLLDTLLRLRDLGNTLIVVEHDEDTIRAADWVVDIGPGRGRARRPRRRLRHGRRPGQQRDVGDRRCTCPAAGRSRSRRPAASRPRAASSSSRARPRTTSRTSTSPSRSAPSSRSPACPGPASPPWSTTSSTGRWPRSCTRARTVPGKHTRVTGMDNLDKVVHVDQGPIGRTPRSNPATYTGVFDHIRKLFAATTEAKVRGYQPGRFSFNVKGGRCEACSGDGTIKIEMQFLPDVYVPCEVCHGARYNTDTLQVHYKGKSIAEVLDMPIEEASGFFEAVPAIHRHLKTLVDVGLGYVRLGQPATTLSGGEAQRVKLATELQRRSTGRTIYVLDEPTTGLHFEDIRKLLGVLDKLVQTGNTVLVIEHNLDVIKTADWIIDMGPEGGNGGGTVVATGTPETVADNEQSYTGQFLRACRRCSRVASLTAEPTPALRRDDDAHDRLGGRARRSGPCPARTAPSGPR